MKIGDHIYLIMDRLQTGAGIHGTIRSLEDFTVEVVVEFTHGPKILKVSNWDDIVPSNLYTHSILNLVYQTYEEIEHKYGSILNLTADEIVAQLIQRDLPRRLLAAVSILFAKSTGTMPHCRFGSGSKAFVTSTIARVQRRNRVLRHLRFAPLRLPSAS